MNKTDVEYIVQQYILCCVQNHLWSTKNICYVHELIFYINCFVFLLLKKKYDTLLHVFGFLLLFNSCSSQINADGCENLFDLLSTDCPEYVHACIYIIKCYDE